MPELPEVETIVRELNRKVVGLKITGAWTDWPKTIKTHGLAAFIKGINSRKILRAHRRAKYIMLDLSGGKTLIIHQKISGHLLYGKWVSQNRNSSRDKDRGKKQRTKSLSFYHDRGKMKVSDRFKSNQKWVAVIPGPLKEDPYNRFIRFILYLSNGWMLGLSDVRRFGKVFLGDTEKIERINEIGRLGPEPLDPKFTLKKFKELMARRKGMIKKVLMDPFVIAGIGNIYSDEILWQAGVSPLRKVESLTGAELAGIYVHIKKVLKLAIKNKGDSKQDFRTLEGKFGNYQNLHRAYQLTGQKCQKRDGGIIKRVKINNRSAHFCPMHQK